MRTLILAVLALLVSFPATAQDFKVPIQGFIDGFVRPETVQFAAVAARLPAATRAVCQDTSETTQTEFRSAFSETVQAYARVHFLRIGPLIEDDRSSRLSFLPDPRGIAQRQIRKIYAAVDSAVLSPDSLAGKSVAVQGLSALELIAFDKTGAVRLGDTGDNRDFTCSYALAITENVASIADRVAADWQIPDGYAGLLLSAGPDNDIFRASKEALETVFNTLVTGIIITRDQDVLPVLGSSEAKAKPRRFPFSRSGNAALYLSGEIGGIRDALFAMNLKVLTPEEFVWLLDTLDFEFGNSQVYVKKLVPPVRQTFKQNNNYGDMKALAIALDSVRELMAQELAGALELVGGFNALDGD